MVDQLDLASRPIDADRRGVADIVEKSTMLPPTSPPHSKSSSFRRRGSTIPKNRMTKLVYKIYT